MMITFTFQKVYNYVEETEENLVHDKTVLPPPQFRDPQPEQIVSMTQENPAKITIPQHFVQHSVNRNDKHSSKSSGSPALSRKSFSVLELRSMFSGEQEHDGNKSKVNRSLTKMMTRIFFQRSKVARDDSFSHIPADLRQFFKKR